MKKLLTHQNVPTCVVKLSYFFQPAASSGIGVMAFLVNVTDFLFAYVWKIGKMKKKRVNSKSSSTETLGRNLLKIAGCIEHTNMLIIFDRHRSTNLFIELMNI